MLVLGLILFSLDCHSTSVRCHDSRPFPPSLSVAINIELCNHRFIFILINKEKSNSSGKLTQSPKTMLRRITYRITT